MLCESCCNFLFSAIKNFNNRLRFDKVRAKNVLSTRFSLVWSTLKTVKRRIKLAATLLWLNKKTYDSDKVNGREYDDSISLREHGAGGSLLPTRCFCSGRVGVVDWISVLSVMSGVTCSELTTAKRQVRVWGVHLELLRQLWEDVWCYWCH